MENNIFKDNMDVGVQGMSAFKSHEMALRSLTGDAPLSPGGSNDYKKKSFSIDSTKKKSESEAFEFATGGEWGKLTEYDRQQLVNEMRNLRAKTDKMINYAGKGRKYALIFAILSYLIYYAKSKGIIPSKLFPSLSAISFASIVCILGLFYQSRAPPNVNGHHPNAPRPYPIIGSALDVVEGAHSGMYKYFLELAKNTNFETIEINLYGGTRFMPIMDAVDRKYVMKDHWKNYLKNSDLPHIISFMDIFAEVLGRGIFNTDKREWQDHRKIASSMFSVNGLRQQMDDVFKAHIKKLVKMLGDIADKGGIVDIQNMFQSFTFDTICEIAFGISPNSLDYAMRGEREPFLFAFDSAQVVCSMRTIDPPLVWKTKKFFGVGNEGELIEHMKFINNYVHNIITKRRQANDLGSKNDLLSLYIQFARKSGQSYIEEEPYLKDVILNFMIAGRDTTACTLTNWFKLVGVSNRGDEIAKRIIDECDQVLKSKQAVELTWDTAQELTYSDAVFNESIRMYPAVACDFRYAEQDDVLPSSGFKVPAGTRILVFNYAIGRDPNLWKDPDTFIPERWVRYLDEDAGKTMLPIKRPDEYVFPVFWGGPRLCLGKDMARFEAKLVACEIFKSFRLEIQPHVENFVNGPVMFYNNPVNAIVKRVN